MTTETTTPSNDGMDPPPLETTAASPIPITTTTNDEHHVPPTIIETTTTTNSSSSSSDSSNATSSSSSSHGRCLHCWESGRNDSMRDTTDKILMESNMQRLQSMLHAQNQLEQWKQKLYCLKQQHKQMTHWTQLRADATYWDTMRKKDKWDRQSICTIYKYHGGTKNGQKDSTLPLALQEEHLSKELILHEDPEVFVCRMESGHCQRYYNTCTDNISCGPPQYLVLPKKLQTSRTIWIRYLQLYANSFVAQIAIDRTIRIPYSSDTIFPPPQLVWKDRELFAALFSYYGHNDHPNPMFPFASILQHVSSHIRNDATFLLQQLKPLEGTESYMPLVVDLLEHCTNNVDKDEKKNWIPLKNNQTFAMTVSNQASYFPKDATIRLFSKRLRDNEEFVTNVVRQKGGCLRYVSFRLRRHGDVVDAACNNDPLALHWCIGSTTMRRLCKNKQRVLRYCQSYVDKKSPLVLDKIFNTNHIGQNSGRDDTIVESSPMNNTIYGRRLWESLPNKLRNDAEVAMWSFIAGCVTANQLSEHLCDCRDFWMSTIVSFGPTWYAIPEHFSKDVEMAKSIIDFVRPQLWIDVQRRFPELQADRNMWIKVVTSDCEWKDLVLMDAPLSILNDKEIVIEACLRDFKNLDLLTFPMIEDRDVIAAALKCSSNALAIIPDWVQLANVDLVAKAIREYDPALDICILYEWIDEGCLQNSEVACAWVACGGPYLRREFEDLEDDYELYLLIAEHSPENFWCASRKLCKDKEFVQKVIRKTPNILCGAPPRLRYDYGLSLIALGGGDGSKEAMLCSRDYAGVFDLNSREDCLFIVGFAQKVRERLVSHDNFVKLVLCGISIKERNQSVLCALDQGGETSLVFIRVLADFTGVPMQQELRLLRQASANLVDWGF